MGITAGGRLAALTNIRKPTGQPGEKSRGLLVLEALEAKRPAGLALNDYKLFNLLIAQATPEGEWSVMYQNEYSRPQDLKNGVHTLSNDSLNSPWPKALRLKADLTHLLTQASEHWEILAFSALGNTEIHPDEVLPTTGVPLEWERMLSAAKIVSPAYGTRASTLLFVNQNGEVTWQERSLNADGVETLRSIEKFQLQWH